MAASSGRPPPLLSLMPLSLASPFLVVVLLLVLSSLACPSAATVTVQGSSIPELNYAFPNTLSHYELSNPGTLFNIPLGTSATNIAAQLAGDVDFAVSLSPLTLAEAAANPNITALPIAATAIVPVYRLDALNASTTLIFSGATLALIYAGNITNWNDSLIQADNAGVSLPDQNITVVFHNTTRYFNYILLMALNKFEPSIASILPPSNLPAWPTSRYAACIGVTGVTGTSAEVVDSDGALSVDAQNYATYMQATIGSMYNYRGNVINTADDSGLSLFFTMAELLTDTPTSPTHFADLTDCHTASCWPIASAAYVLIDTYASPRGCEVRGAVVNFLLWYYQQTNIVERMLSDYGLQSLSDELQEPFDVSDVLAGITCWGVPVVSSIAGDVYNIVGVDRLLPLTNMVVDLHAIADSSVDFEYYGMTSTEAMLDGQSTLQLAVLYDVEINSTTTPIDYEQYVLLPSFLTSIIVTFNTQLSPTVRLNESELIVDKQTLTLIILGNISDWSDPRLLALNPSLSTVLDGNPAPIRLIHGCSTLDPGTTTAPLLTYLYWFLLSTIETDPVVLDYITSPAGVQVQQTLLACSQAANTGRFSDWLYVASDDTVSTLVSNRPGSIGYAMDGNSAESVGDAVGAFAIWMTGEVDGESVDTVRRSTPAALAACASTGTLDSSTLVLDLSASWTNSECWPLTQVVYMQIPRDYPTDSYNMGLAAVNLLHWVYSTAALDVWSNQNMLVRTASLPSLQSVLLSVLDGITSGGTTVLTQAIVWQLTPAIAYGAYAIEAFGCLVTAVFIGLTVRYRQHALLRSASPLFMVVSLLGVMLLFGAILALVLTPTASSCAAFSWLIQLGFTVTFAPLFAKAYRIYRIFGRRKLSVVKISNRRLLAAVILTILADVILLSVWHSVAPPTVSVIVQLTTTATGTIQQNGYPQCAWNGTSASFMGVECGIKVVSLCLGVMLAFSTRQVTDRFNDSKSISLSIYNLVFALVVILPILVLIDAVGNVRILLLLFCIAEIGFVTLGVLFLPKLFSFLASNNNVMPVMSTSNTSVYQHSSNGYSFLSTEQLAGLPHLTRYIAALTRHVDDAKRVLATRQQVKALVFVGGGVGNGGPRGQESASETSTPLDTDRKRDSARGLRVESSEVRKKSVYMKSSHSQLVSPAAAPSRAGTLSRASDPSSFAAHSRAESGGQDKEVESALKEAAVGAASVASPRSLLTTLALATSPRAIGPLLGMDNEVAVSSFDNNIVKAAETMGSG